MGILFRMGESKCAPTIPTLPYVIGCADEYDVVFSLKRYTLSIRVGQIAIWNTMLPTNEYCDFIFLDKLMILGPLGRY